MKIIEKSLKIIEKSLKIIGQDQRDENDAGGSARRNPKRHTLQNSLPKGDAAELWAENVA